MRIRTVAARVSALVVLSALSLAGTAWAEGFFLKGAYRVFSSPFESRFSTPTTAENIEDRATQVFATDSPKVREVFDRVRKGKGGKLPQDAHLQVRVKVLEAATGEVLLITSLHGIIYKDRYFDKEEGLFHPLFGEIVGEVAKRRFLVSGPGDLLPPKP